MTKEHADPRAECWAVREAETRNVDFIGKKSIIVKKFGKKNKIELHLIDHKENCVTDDSDHTDIKSFEGLIEEIKIQFDLNEPVIRPEYGRKNI